MALSPGRYAIGPDTGQLRIYTRREGVAAKVGHDLLITFRRWSGTIQLDDPGTANVDVEIEVRSLEIVDGTGGALPLSGGDRDDITSTALRLLEAHRYPTALFGSTRVTPSSDGASIEGALTIRGHSEPLTLDVLETGPSTWTASVRVLQSAFGIKPYKAFFGALRLADEVRIGADVNLSNPS
jgi:polyisoprenoid-binding protein YceI